MIKQTIIGSLCPSCHRFGIDGCGICDYCGNYRDKVVRVEEAIFEGRLYWKIFVNGSYIGYGFSEKDAEEFGNKYARLNL